MSIISLLTVTSGILTIDVATLLITGLGEVDVAFSVALEFPSTLIKR
ncbi:Putative uncharacterized protein [Moritella viscosa]|nr:Putative uncharacterized protein [Moritella viscosa]SHO08183.1 Putative uncharacterized protein [Moritella viscosa]SHO08240.1 Putative uncharacterized protein [Moritella viscosa]SHO09211.1 Putative uncharacterized protein [Moritella viscosa]SHO12555.1 Putative uncharacterized protein [Moritella viscosa]